MPKIRLEAIVVKEVKGNVDFSVVSNKYRNNNESLRTKCKDLFRLLLSNQQDESASFEESIGKDCEDLMENFSNSNIVNQF